MRAVDVRVRVPEVSTVGPRQYALQRRKEVEDSVGDDDVVINTHENVQHNHAHSDSFLTQKIVFVVTFAWSGPTMYYLSYNEWAFKALSFKRKGASQLKALQPSTIGQT